MERMAENDPARPAPEPAAVPGQNLLGIPPTLLPEDHPDVEVAEAVR